MGADEESGSLSPRQRRALTRVPSDRVRIITLAAAGLVVSFMQTIVVPIIPHLPAYLHTTAADAQWVLTSTLLAGAVSTPIAGRLGDMFGKRRVLLGLLLCLLVGAIVSAFSNALIPMIVGRVLQGVGIGAIPLGISVLRDIVHPRSLGAAIALVSATLGVGGAAGLPLAAAVAEAFDFHWLFWMAAALAALVFVAVIAFIPVSTLRTGGRVDWLGALGLAAGLTGTLLGVSKGSEWGWLSPLTLAVFSGSAIVFVVWGLYQLRAGDPLIDLRTSARRPVLMTNLASIAIGFAFFATTATLPVVLESPAASGAGFGLPLLLASLCLMPLGIVMFLVSPLAGQLSQRHGPRTSLLVGGLIVTIGYLVATIWFDQLWHVLMLSTIMGLGIGFAYAAMPNLIMRSVPPTDTGAANGLNAVMRTVGSSTAAAVVGMILSTQTVVLPGLEVPSRSAYAWVFAVGAAVSLVGVVLTLLIPRRMVGLETASIPTLPRS